MRLAALVLLLVAAGCTGQPSAEPPPSALPPGCGLVPASKVVGLLGEEVRAVVRGSVGSLVDRRAPLRCTTTVPGHPERFVTITAQHHPAPFDLPTRSCNAGWVYAGTPDKYTPACQQTDGRNGTTQLVVRWQPYVVRVWIGRADRNWAGDPEAALALSRALAEELGVEEAAGRG
jgi:hypothetical protein